MRLNIIDPNTLELVGVLTQYESVQWAPTFNTPDGTFQINCSTDYITSLPIDYYIENTEEPEHIGVIKRIQTISTNEKSSLQVSGVMLEKDIFYKRVVKAWIVYEDMYPTTIMSNLIGMSLTEPAETTRVVQSIGKVIMPKDIDVPDMEKIEYSANYPNLGDEIFNLIQNLNLGVKARINHKTYKIEIEFYTGNDYTFGSDDPVVFSPERGTVLETDYTKDSSQNFTNVIVIGEDNVILQAERERKSEEPIIEKSVDLSSEYPWPTYKVEKPEEDGGQYYRYKKFTPPEDFITNRDVWEKYAVDRIETTETRYREVESPTTGSITVGQLLESSELRSNARVDSANGLIMGSPIPSSTALESALANLAAGGSVSVGTLVRSNISKALTNSSSETPVAAVNSVQSISSKAAKNNSSGVKKTDTLVSKTSKNGLGSTLKEVGSGGTTTVDRIIAVRDREGSDYELQSKQVTLEEYEVTVVTYETKDFIEYVYVNTGDFPSESTKIVQGSFASGDAIYYENFEDVRIEEAKYRDSLMKKAQEYLKTFVLSEIVEVKPYHLSNIVYGKQYTLGDLVTARNTKLGYTTDLRVTQVTETWDSKGYTIETVLGDSIPSLTNRIRLIAKGGA